MKETLQAHSPATLCWLIGQASSAGAMVTVMSNAMASCDDTVLTCSAWNVTSHKANSGLAAKSWSGIASEVLAHRGRVDSDSVAPTLPQPVAVANTLRCGGCADKYSNGIRAALIASGVVTSYR